MNKCLCLTAIVAASLATGYAADVKEDWKTHCAKCHGDDGKGQTTMGKKLKVKDYTTADEQKKFTDEEAFKAVKDGKKDGEKTLMKAFTGVISDDEIKALVKHVREFKK